MTVAVVAPAVPDSVTSASVKPVTGSLNTTSNSTEDSAVGSFCVEAWLIVTVGGVWSHWKPFAPGSVSIAAVRNGV